MISLINRRGLLLGLLVVARVLNSTPFCFFSMSRHVIKILQLHLPDRLCESEVLAFSCTISDLGSKCSYLDITYLLISIKMWLASILIINTLTLLTIAHADRGRPTLKDDERFRNGYFHDLKIRTLMCTRTILCKNSRTILCKTLVSITLSHITNIKACSILRFF